MSLPYTFVPYTTIFSAQVNANFQYVAIYDIAMGYTGTPPATTTLFTFNAVRTFTLPVALQGSIFTFGTAPSASTVLTIQQNGTTIGTVTWSASATYGTASFLSQITFAAGDLITIVTPSTLNGAANLAMTLSGNRI